MRALGVLALFLFVLSAVPLFADEDPVVARIGEKKILLSDFRRWMSYDTEEGRKTIERDPKQKDALLRSIVTSMAIAAQARKEKFDQRPDIKENIQLLIDNFLTVKYLDQVVAKTVEPTEDNVKRYYEDHKKELMAPEMVRAPHILIKVTRTASEEERTKARKQAEDLLKRLKAGEDFAKLAAEYSEDPGSKKKGGDLGFFPRGMMAPEFETAAFSLEPGAMSDVVETDFGYHIIKVEEKKPASVQPYQDVKEGLKKRATIELKRKAVDDYVTKLMKEARIEFDAAPLFGSDPHAK